VYNDWTWARTNVTITNGNNTYTAIASDNLGRSSTNSVSVYLPTNISYAYDLNGNLLSDGYRTFIYDDENQLTSVVVSNGLTTSTLTSNIYDGKLRRRIRKDYVWNSGWIQTAEVHYIYDGNLMIQERDANNLPTVSYTRGRDLSGSLQAAGGIGGLLARSQFQATTSQLLSPHAYYHCDGNGNITALINSLQLVVAEYEYDPYGNITSQSGSLADANTLRFSSKEFEKQTGLIYYTYRFYAPNYQRWVNRDPISDIGFMITRALGRHEIRSRGWATYVYAFNNPGRFFDAFGLSGGTITAPSPTPGGGGGVGNQDGGGGDDPCPALAKAAGDAMRAALDDPANITLQVLAAAAAARFEEACGQDYAPKPKICPPEVPEGDLWENFMKYLMNGLDGIPMPIFIPIWDLPGYPVEA
jgi:RHS repeat-associated protein